ncbi:MAG: DUF503 domain-containing protein [Armatimonadota bacterium]|nr:DUF503 domain-containing protein [Armatimonadota bacterium]MDR7466573.1 DUF503 domain-containing protein [Armatimonadota bacterium]MDR7495105.1 DUF503 domain-containing protein [Armatimonadota bacterium]MDR7500179.1 DUF503 domain-containing protein [Armatimonadota bacterium]MDR7505643.1 DUF503 domain-containing protein [Armatimonadota bacterium]
MVVGVLRLQLSLPGSTSLKDKRRLLRSLLDRLHQTFNVSAAEVDRQDSRRHAEVGISYVSSTSAHASAVLSRVLDLVERESEIVVTGVELEWR